MTNTPFTRQKAVHESIMTLSHTATLYGPVISHHFIFHQTLALNLRFSPPLYSLLKYRNEMVEEGRAKTMSIELAIRRELAYREKVRNLLSCSEWNSLKDLSQVSSNQPVDPNPRPTQSQISNSNAIIPYSTPCHVSLPQPTGPTPAHNQGHSWNTSQIPAHRPQVNPASTRPSMKRKAATSFVRQHRKPPSVPPQRPQSGFISIDERGIFFCKVCQVSCTGADNLKSHLKGQKHKANLRKPVDNSTVTGQSRCDICGIFCTDQNCLEMHFRGQKHKAKVEEMESASKNREEQKSETPWCELCQIWCMNDDSLQQHLKGKSHILRLHSARGNTRPPSRTS